MTIFLLVAILFEGQKIDKAEEISHASYEAVSHASYEACIPCFL